MNDSILKVKGLSKYYGAIHALSDVSMEFRRGEVHALCGENGAGKSTFIKLLTGASEPTHGTIEYEGVIYKNLTPRQAMNLGITVIYQEFSLIPYLTVAGNIFYGREKSKHGFINQKDMDKRARQLCKDMNVDLDVHARVCDLGVAYQEIVEILKAVSQKSKFIIMDEPTAPLTIKETEVFFNIIRKLKENHTTIIFISHRLEEVFEICDRVTVLCDGHYITTQNVEDIDKKHLISYMVGRELTDEFPKSVQEPGEVVLKVENLENKHVKDVNFELRRGEILGFGGLVGAGRTELARAIFGADPVQNGRIELKGKPYVPRSPKHALELGIGLIPEDRKAQGVVLGMTIKENVAYSSLKQFSKFSVIRKKEERKCVDQYIAQLNIKTPNMEQFVHNLSGGNQQKVVLAKILATNCDVLIFDEPTRGIDVGAKQEIYSLMCSLLAEGKAIIMISSEMPELIGMSSRIIVMSNGCIGAELMGDDITQENILEIASGKLSSKE